jgi:copper chaperone CopZ
MDEQTRSKKGQTMKTMTYTVPAIHCGHCTHTIELELGELDGVRSVKADQATKSVVVAYDAPADDEKIRALLLQIEYPAA